MDVSLIASVGIDLGKTTFHLVALDCHAKVIVRKKLSRTQLLAYTANLPWSIIGMEACSGAHFFAAKLRNQGHEVKLIPGQFVKPFVKTNKNDFNDAEAIAEAVTRQNMRFVPIKTDDQLDLQALHRVRDRLVHRRTALINQIRGFLLERGIAFPKGPANLRNQMPVILEDAERNMGPLVSTAMVAAIGNGAAFRNGRDFAAWLGLVPRQHSTGGKPQTVRHQQAREHLLATHVRPRSAGGAASCEVRHRRSGSVGASARGTHSTQQSDRRHR